MSDTPHQMPDTTPDDALSGASNEAPGETGAANGGLDPSGLREALKQVIGPEIFENIVDLGLVYEIQVEPEAQVTVTMTLTTPHCPLGPEIVANVEKVLKAEGAQAVRVNIVWEPMWTPDMMAPELKAKLGIEEEPELEIEAPSPPPPPPPPKKKGLLSRLFGR